VCHDDVVRASLVAIVILWGAGAAAEPIVGAVGGPKDAVLVGNRGETYVREGGAWRRHGGGTAGSLVMVTGAAANDFLAMGDSTPAYRHDEHEWSVRPIAHGGRACLGGPGSSTVAVAVGRRISVEVREGPGWRWQDLPALDAPVEAFWTSGPKDVVAAGGDGRLWRLAGTSWRPIAQTPGGEAVASLVGNGRVLVSVGRAGGLYAIAGARASRVAADPRLGAYRVVLAAVAGAKVFTLGRNGDAWTLATVEKGKLVPLGDLPPWPAGDDPVALLADDEGAIVCPSRGGVVALRDAAGAWTVEKVDPTPVAETHPALPPAPAR
jgi:hypothetical protein